MSKKCAVRWCEEAPASRGTLCSEHWTMVPHYLRAQIWDEYRPGQSPKTSSARYRTLMARATRIAAQRTLGGMIV